MLTALCLTTNLKCPSLIKKPCLNVKVKISGSSWPPANPYIAVLPIIKMLDLCLPQITLNGTVTLDKNQEVLSSTKIGEQYYYEVLSAIKQKGYKPLIALTDGRILYDSFHSIFSVFEKINEPIYEVDRLEKDIYARDCVSLSAVIKEDDPLDAYLRERFSEKMQLVRSGEYFFDVLNLNASKGNALDFIANMLKINKG